MGTIDYGTPQLLTFDYNQDATAKLFNGINFKLTPIGIYEGFTLTRISNSYITVSVGTCFIQDSSVKTGTRISTGSEQQVQVTSATPYIVLRFDWVDSPNNYMDILAVAYADINSDDLIVGRCIYDDAGTTLSSSFDYTRRTNQFLQKQKTESTYLRVAPTEPYSKKFIISSGILNSSKGNLLVAGITYGSDIPDTINGRNDLVWIDENGTVQVLQGTDSSSPITPRYGNRKVVAEIRRGAARTSIRGNEIVQVITSFDSAPITSDLLITDAGSLYATTNVENALQEIAGSQFTFKGLKTFDNGISVKESQTVTGASNSDIQTLKKSDGTIIQRNDLNGKFINTIGSEIAFLDTYSKYTTDKLDSAINQIAGEAMSIGGVKTFTSSPVIPVATSDDQAANFSQVVRLSSDQTIGGVKTFTSSPVVPTATMSTQAVNFGQVVKNSGDEVIDGMKVFRGPIVGSLNGNALYSMNFDLVIDSDAKLAQWASSGTGEKVLIKSGTWTLASGGVDLTARGTKLVVGEPGSKLVFSSAAKGLYYTTRPTTNDYRMEGVTVETTSSSTGTGFSFGFAGCTNLTNCTGTSTGTGTGGVGAGFTECTNLTNCTGTGTSTGTGGAGAGFTSCTNLTNCTGTGTGVYGYGFTSCTKCQQNKKGSNSTTATYNACYASSTINATYACADTANGGFNS